MAVKDVGPRIGADPEIFIKNSVTKDIVPVCGKVGGTKKEPINITGKVVSLFGDESTRKRPIDSRGFYAVQEDNVMLEFNVPAYKEPDAFVSSISKALGAIESYFLTPGGYEYAWGAPPHHSFQEEVLSMYPQALDIGCSCDYYAYAEDSRFKREPYTAAFFGNRRFCGGHIHVQYDTDAVPEHVFAQFMDCVAALPYLAWDKQGGRRLFYGQPGLYRPKQYGIEYRTLSNFWIQPDFRENFLLDLVDNISRLASSANENPDFLVNAYVKIPWEIVQSTIRAEDHEKAVDIVNYLRSKLKLPINGVPKRVA